MIQAGDFIQKSISRGFTLFAGVPCTLLKPLINYVIQCKDVDYIAATNEGEALGIASGAYLTGRKAVVMCQNSGLGNMVNPLTSLNFPFRIPTLLIITLRGEPGLKDEPEHELMGRITGELLDTLRIKWAFFPSKPDEIDAVLSQAEREMTTTGFPFALIIKKGVIAETGVEASVPTALKTGQSLIEGEFRCKISERMSRLESIRIIRQAVADKYPIIATTGKIGRELFTLGDSNNQLYVVGSMGCAAAIGFGVQYARPQKRVIVLDGDGAVLMKMGTLATIGYYQPEGFIHIVLDNEIYESTGGQYSVSPAVDFCKSASACGYRQCYRVDTKKDLVNAVNSAARSSGPSLIHLKVLSGSAPDLGRPTLKPFEVKERFMKFMERETEYVR